MKLLKQCLAHSKFLEVIVIILFGGLDGLWQIEDMETLLAKQKQGFCANLSVRKQKKMWSVLIGPGGLAHALAPPTSETKWWAWIT